MRHTTGSVYAIFDKPVHMYRGTVMAGIITDGDLRRSLQRIGSGEIGFSNIKCDELMTRDPIVTNPEMLAFDALRLMEDRPSQINVLPVVDGDRRCIGLIRLHDIVRSGL